MRYLIIVLSLGNGLWMLADGIYVSLNGKYIGPEKPGPWAWLIGLTGVDVFKIGPVFIALGIAWLIFVSSFWLRASWARNLGLILSILTLWYLPVGSLISIVVFIVLAFVLKAG